MSGSLATRSTPFDHLVYLRIFEGCNLHCKHCFIPANPKKMSMEDIARIPETVAKVSKPGDTILLQWHGGEPTMFGAKYLKDAIDLIESSQMDRKWRHGIQTNLMNYTSEFADLYHNKFGGEVGVSWDPGTIRRTRANDDSSSKDFHEKFFRNLEQLIKDGIDPFLVVTATREFFNFTADPFALFDLMAKHNIKRGHIERLTRTGTARENWDVIGVNNAQYTAGMSRILRAYMLRKAEDVNFNVNLSPFDGLMTSVQHLEGAGYGCWSGQCDTTFHTIDASGYKKGCSAVTSEYDNSRLPDGVQPIKFMNYAKSRSTRRSEFHCDSCEYHNICSSGCLASDITDGSGECSGGKQLFKVATSLINCI